MSCTVPTHRAMSLHPRRLDKQTSNDSALKATGLHAIKLQETFGDRMENIYCQRVN